MQTNTTTITTTPSTSKAVVLGRISDSEMYKLHQERMARLNKRRSTRRRS